MTISSLLLERCFKKIGKTVTTQYILNLTNQITDVTLFLGALGGSFP